MRVLLGNFEVEDRWAAGELGLPRTPVPATRAMANRMDEFALLLAGERDHVVLKDRPDDDYLSHLDGLGIALPAVLVADRSDPDRTVTEDALDAPALTAGLRGLEGARLHPHGVSADEERLAERCGLPLDAPPAHVCKKVNSKIYSRELAGLLGIRQPRGMPCRDLTDLAAAFGQAAEALADGRTIVLKDAFGVSGKGMLVITERRMLDGVLRMIRRRAERIGREDLALVVEEWVPKDLDLNYQFTVDRRGGVRFDFVKEAFTERGVHIGHRMPAGIAPALERELRATAQALGERLAADGYFGVVGVDAMVDPDGGLYPVTEINARNNMSTYQERVRRTLTGPRGTAIATRYPVRLPRPLPFAELAPVLDGLLLTRAGGEGLLVNNFATVNAAAHLLAQGRTATFEGRLYAMAFAETQERAAAIHEETRTRLARWSRGDDHDD